MKLLYTFAYINILKAEEDAPQIRVTKIAHLDITVNGEPQGTVDIGLFGDQVPKTVKNFETLCGDGFKREGDEQVYSYNGTRIHRINKSFMLQAGDIINQDGTGSISIYGDTFDDENFDLKHYDEQWVSMGEQRAEYKWLPVLRTLRRGSIPGRRACRLCKGNSSIIFLESGASCQSFSYDLSHRKTQNSLFFIQFNLT
ncbi:unnamed protein product [Oikopleura dioica]|uniref:Peptidyl-prolyl cis-trans isomerase n=1 Tax=Oikopleura dioica TaxID=34765 RepID=E4YRV2_OIKDI|nr:unnamed protein product [Oikopleura dioica]